MQKRLLPLAWEIMLAAQRSESRANGRSWTVFLRKPACLSLCPPRHGSSRSRVDSLAIDPADVRVESGIPSCGCRMRPLVIEGFGAAIAAGNGAAISCSKQTRRGQERSWSGRSTPLLASFVPGSDADHDEAWFLRAFLPASPRLLSLYAYRMRVEATFQDSKSRRWCIESSQLRDARHLNRWLLIIFIAFWWTTHLGASCKHHGHAKAFDRTDRYDKSLLRLGHLWIKEMIKRANLGLRQ